MSYEPFIAGAVAGAFIGLGLAGLLKLLEESRAWRALVRAYLEQRAHKQLVPDPAPSDEPVSSVHLPPDLQAEIEWREEQERLV